MSTTLESKAISLLPSSTEMKEERREGITEFIFSILPLQGRGGFNISETSSENV